MTTTKHVENVQERARMMLNEMVRQEEELVRRELQRRRIIAQQNRAAEMDGLAIRWEV